MLGISWTVVGVSVGSFVAGLIAFFILGSFLIIAKRGEELDQAHTDIEDLEAELKCETDQRDLSERAHREDLDRLDSIRHWFLRTRRAIPARPDCERCAARLELRDLLWPASRNDVSAPPEDGEQLPIFDVAPDYEVPSEQVLKLDRRTLSNPTTTARPA